MSIDAAICGIELSKVLTRAGVEHAVLAHSSGDVIVPGGYRIRPHPAGDRYAYTVLWGRPVPAGESTAEITLARSLPSPERVAGLILDHQAGCLV